MSEVFSFRLKKTNHREALALEILESWCSRGYTLRNVITEALLRFDEEKNESMAINTAGELNTILERVKMLLEKIEKNEDLQFSEQYESSIEKSLTDDFIASIRRDVKPGTKIC